MVFLGELCLKHDTDDYIIFSKGRLVNLTDELHTLLLEEVRFTIKSMYNKNVLLQAEGKLIKQRVSKCFYLFHVGDADIDSVLWNMVGSKIEVEINNISNK